MSPTRDKPMQDSAARSAQDELLARLKAGDERALTDLANEYGVKIYQLAFRYLRNREDAEEVTQDVLFKVYQKIDAFRGDAALSSWIYRITFNAAMSRLREFKQNLPNAPEKGGDDSSPAPLKREVVDWSPLADEEVFRAEMRKTLVRALQGLPLLYRAAVILRDVEGLN